MHQAPYVTYNITFITLYNFHINPMRMKPSHAHFTEVKTET